MKSQRAKLVIQYTNGRQVPADIIGSLRKDLLGSGVHVNLATLASVDDKRVATFFAELTGSNLPEDAKLQQIAQTALDAVYGVPEIRQESPKPEPPQPSSEPAPVETPASSVADTPSESSSEQSNVTATTTEDAKPEPKKQPAPRKTFINIAKPAAPAQTTEQN